MNCLILTQFIICSILIRLYFDQKLSISLDKYIKNLIVNYYIHLLRYSKYIQKDESLRNRHKKRKW